MNGKYRVAVVGTGGMGSRWAKLAMSHMDSQLSALIDIDRHKAEILHRSLNSSAKIFFNLKEALNRSMIDIVVVATPHKFLGLLSREALTAGKHVLCEKPGGVNARELQKNFSLAQKNNLRYMIAFNHRFHPAVWKAKELFEKGIIGKLLFMRGCYGHGGRAGYEKEWRASKEMGGGGELLDQGVHLLDLSRWFAGEPVAVKSFITTNFWKINPLEDNAFVLLKNRNDIITQIHVSWTQWKKTFLWEIYGDKGYLAVNGLGGKYQTETLTIGRRNKDFSVFEKQIEFKNAVRIDPDDSLYGVWGEFISAIRQKRDPIPSGYDGWKTLSIVEKIYGK